MWVVPAFDPFEDRHPGFGLALGYEDLNDHERLRTDAVFGVLAGKIDEPLAGKSMARRSG